MPKKERVKKVVDWLKYQNIISSRKDLAKKLNYTESSISQILNGRVPISDLFIKNLSILHSDINTNWLLTGEGEMLISPQNDLTEISQEKTKESINLYNMYASAEFFETYGELTPIDSIYMPNIPYADGAIFAIGESMQPIINNGDIIAFRIIHDAQHIHWGEIYIVSYNDGGDSYTCVKQLKPLDDGKIQLISINDNYAPIEIPANTITHLALVVASVSMRRFSY